MRKVCAPIVALVLAFGVAACGSSSSTSGGASSANKASANAGSFKVCMATGGPAVGPWTTSQGVVMAAVAKQEGWSSVVLNNNFSASTALSNAQTFVVDKCSVVVEANFQPSSNAVIAQKFAAAKIPVITFDVAQKGWYFVGIDNLKAGILGGTALGAVLKQRWDCHVDAVVASHAYAAGITDTLRTGGMVTGLMQACPNITKSMVYSVNGDAVISQTAPLARALFAAHPSWKKVAVVGLNDAATVGVIQAAQELGRSQDVVGWGQDGDLLQVAGHNPKLLGSDLYFLEGYPEYTVSLLKSIAAGHAPAIHDNTNGHNATVLVPPCPVTGVEAAKVPSLNAITSHLSSSTPGTSAYTLYCPTK